MTTANITIKTIETEPYLDAHHRDTSQPTYTQFLLDTEDGAVYITQEYDDNATPSRQWHGIDLSCRIHGWPLEDMARQFVEENMDLLTRILVGADTVWDGSNHVGKLTDDARAAWAEFTELCEDYFAGEENQYTFWAVDDWCYEGARGLITADTTDADLDKIISYFEADAEHEHIVTSSDIGEYLREFRQELIDEQEE